MKTRQIFWKEPEQSSVNFSASHTVKYVLRHNTKIGYRTTGVPETGISLSLLFVGMPASVFCFKNEIASLQDCAHCNFLQALK